MVEIRSACETCEQPTLEFELDGSVGRRRPVAIPRVRPCRVPRQLYICGDKAAVGVAPPRTPIDSRVLEERRVLRDGMHIQHNQVHITHCTIARKNQQIEMVVAPQRW